jgi:phage-related protein
MNYIELNGKSSLDVQGLLVQSLAPITKPKIRTQVEEIDGRDGDIVTRLGYSAYDKEISIGLYGNYDIDEVIQYFVENDKGTVLFSNEEEKIYKYEILDQVDFEKLLRFKTAKVKFHVQPFKMSSIEDKTIVNISSSNSTIEGTSVTFNSSSDSSLSTLLINGISKQITTPTAKRPCNIISLGDNGAIELKRTSVNTLSYSIPLSDPLRSLPNGVKDALDLTGIHKNVGKYKFTGVETWADDSANGYAYLMISKVTSLSDLKPYGYVYSNYFKNGTSSESGVIFVGESAIAITYNEDIPNLATLKKFLASNNVYAIYELSTQKNVSFTQAQQTVINSIQAKKGVNTFSVSGTPKPTIKITVADTKSFMIRNNGNTYAKPMITIHGSGTINLSLNNYQIFVIELGDNEQITIDTNLLDAYNNDTKELMNRLVTGNYDNFKLNVGNNTISWTGSVSSIEISNYSRWI